MTPIDIDAVAPPFGFTNRSAIPPGNGTSVSKMFVWDSARSNKISEAFPELIPWRTIGRAVSSTTAPLLMSAFVPGIAATTEIVQLGATDGIEIANFV